MRYIVLMFIVLNFMLNIISYNALGISSKLDLDSLQPSARLIDTANRHRTLSHRHIDNKDTKSKDDLEDLGIVCISGEGCNSTKSEDTNHSNDSIKTDVVVHVKTTVDLNENKKTKVVEDTPDVPIIIGTDSKKYNDDQNIIVNSNPSILLGEADGVVPINRGIPSTAQPIFSRRRPFTSSLQSDSLYTQKFEFVPAEPRVDIKVEHIPTVTIEKDGRSILNNYKTNGMELQIPRFEPSYHTHYFDENPPPQVVWYPKTVDFGYKPTVKPPAWSVGVINSASHKHHGRPGTTCTCNNEVGRGLQWYPKRPGYGNEAGTQINDKLAPLT